mmetsp:Transcript_30535/g.83882  ORF Transcript_30535/g.83882 Transcript_30535/m.83882 type:complete len:423 (+) Transcript_30535:71-1339(+)
MGRSFGPRTTCHMLEQNGSGRHQSVDNAAAANNAGDAIFDRAGDVCPKDLEAEVTRILSADSSIEVFFGIGSREVFATDEDVVREWKRRVRWLHPDKIQGFGLEFRKNAVEALHRLHLARDDLRTEVQWRSNHIFVPEAPELVGTPTCTIAERGRRQYAFSWRALHSMDKNKPIEEFQVWGPRAFARSGMVSAWVRLALLPPLQGHFVFVEEDSLQQAVMREADRAQLITLPIALHAVNGRGCSDPLIVSLPWSSNFPWVQGGVASQAPGHAQSSRAWKGLAPGACGAQVDPSAGDVATPRSKHDGGVVAGGKFTFPAASDAEWRPSLWGSRSASSASAEIESQAKMPVSRNLTLVGQLRAASSPPLHKDTRLLEECAEDDWTVWIDTDSAAYIQGEAAAEYATHSQEGLSCEEQTIVLAQA